MSESTLAVTKEHVRRVTARLQGRLTLLEGMCQAVRKRMAEPDFDPEGPEAEELSAGLQRAREALP